MPDVATIVQAMLGPKGVLFWLATAIAALATIAIFLVNNRSRGAIDAALTAAADRPAPGMFELCRAGSPDEVRGKALAVPERLWCYDDAYLTRFAETASRLRTRLGDDALRRYLKPTLFWNDIAFAVALGVFAALVALGLAPLVPFWQPWTGYVMVVLACLGLIYGFADVAEDWALFTILGKGLPVDRTAAAAANALTRVKIATISLSLIGGVVFLVLSLAARLLSRSGA
jgi:hypothetical protein